MAIKEIKREWSPCQLDYVKTFLLHSEKELKDLPKCCIGSKAIVSETDNEYYCTESGWKLGSELGSSEVVILPETELQPASVTPGEGGAYMIVDTPFEITPTAGTTGKLVWGGVEYTSKIVDISSMMGAPEGTAFAMGNFAVEGEPPEGIENPAPDAPCLLMMFPEGQVDEVDGSVVYGQVISVGITPDPPVLSIVQTEGAASGGAADSPVVIAKLTGSGSNITIDKTFDEIVSLVKSGKIVYLQNITADTATTMMLANYSGSATPKTLNFAAPVGGNMVATVTYTPDGATMTLEKH